MDRTYWPKWAQTLQRLNLKGFSLVVLEGAGPLKLVLAQLMLAGTPFFSGSTRAQVKSAAEMLEDKDESHIFADFIREE